MSMHGSVSQPLLQPLPHQLLKNCSWSQLILILNGVLFLDSKRIAASPPNGSVRKRVVIEIIKINYQHIIHTAEIAAYHCVTETDQYAVYISFSDPAGSCARDVCDCDLEFAACLRGQPVHNVFLNYDRTQCKLSPPRLVVQDWLCTPINFIFCFLSFDHFHSKQTVVNNASLPFAWDIKLNCKVPAGDLWEIRIWFHEHLWTSIFVGLVKILLSRILKFVANDSINTTLYK